MYVWINDSSDSFSRCNRPLKYSRIDKYGIHCINPSITAKKLNQSCYFQTGRILNCEITQLVGTGRRPLRKHFRTAQLSGAMFRYSSFVCMHSTHIGEASARDDGQVLGAEQVQRRRRRRGGACAPRLLAGAHRPLRLLHAAVHVLQLACMMSRAHTRRLRGARGACKGTPPRGAEDAEQTRASRLHRRPRRPRRAHRSRIEQGAAAARRWSRGGGAAHPCRLCRDASASCAGNHGPLRRKGHWDRRSGHGPSGPPPTLWSMQSRDQPLCGLVTGLMRSRDHLILYGSIRNSESRGLCSTACWPVPGP
jgi:hypothetical protein